MTLKKNLENEHDTTWRRKGHIHRSNVDIPEVCPVCHGVGTVPVQDGDTVCQRCNGLGEI